MSDRPSHLYVRLTDEQEAALLKAIDRHKRRLGIRPSRSDVAREGIRNWCFSEGVRFPDYEARNQPRRRRAKRTAKRPSTNRAASIVGDGRLPGAHAGRTDQHSRIAPPAAG